MAAPTDLNFHLNRLLCEEKLQKAYRYQQAAEVPRKAFRHRGRLIAWMSMVAGLLGWGQPV